MKVLELFSGTGTFARIAREEGHETFTVDLHERADLNIDVRALSAQGVLEAAGWDRVDAVWASPPCTGFSVASIGRMWERPGVPKHPTAELGMALLDATLRLIDELTPAVWFIENPRGMMRRMPALADRQRHTVTFCQYGERRMKPTDIWTNSTTWHPRAACKNGDPCHEPAPRGSRTGTQGITGALARAKLPEELCREVARSLL